MIVCSWNMLFRNKRLEEALAFIRSSDADLFCLQEAPETMLAHLGAMPYQVAETKEVDLLYRGRTSSSHLVILSRYPIVRSGAITMGTLAIPPFARALYAAGIWALATSERCACFADLETPQGLIRVFNLHLPLQQPAMRAYEFERAMKERGGDMPAIVCGDFNTLEKPHVAVLTPLLGGRVGTWLWWRRERGEMERRFAAHGFANPLRGHQTHPLSRSQLDHILVSSAFTIESAEVLPTRHGSDHYPIRLRIRKAAPTTTKASAMAAG